MSKSTNTLRTKEKGQAMGDSEREARPLSVEAFTSGEQPNLSIHLYLTAWLYTHLALQALR